MPARTRSRRAPACSSQLNADRMLPDIDPDLESLIQRMTSLLLIEISAFHIFAWAEEVLADTDLTAGDGEAVEDRLLHPRRRDAARRVPQDHADRDARPHLHRHERQEARRRPTSSARCGTRPWPTRLVRAARRTCRRSTTSCCTRAEDAERRRRQRSSPGLRSPAATSSCRLTLRTACCRRCRLFSAS